MNMAQRAHLVACGAPIALHGSVRVTERFDVLQSVCDGLSPPRTQPHRTKARVLGTHITALLNGVHPLYPVPE